MPTSSTRVVACVNLDLVKKNAKPQVLFHESQSLRPWHTRLVLAMPPAALVFIAVRQLGFHQPWTHPPMTNGDVIFLTVLLVAVYLRLITVRLVTVVRTSDLSLGLRGLWRMRRIPLSEIGAVAPVRFDAAKDFGGYGVRSGARGTGYIASGDRGVEFELTDRQKILVGSQRPEELAARIMQAKAAAS